VFALPKGNIRSFLGKKCFLVPGDACLRGIAFGLRACEIEYFDRVKKLRAVIGAVICRRSRANTRSGHDAAQASQAGAESECRPHIEMMSGSRKRDAV
jgi:hypothetical protein